MSFANFVFYPLVIGTIIAVIIEQILRSVGEEDDAQAVRRVTIAMSVRTVSYTHLTLPTKA